MLNEKYTAQLPVPMSEKERAIKGDELAKVGAEIKAKETEKAEAMANFNAELATLKKYQGKIEEAINTKTRLADVECIDVLNTETGLIECHRLDKKKTDPARIFNTRDANLFDVENHDADEAAALADAAEEETKAKAKKKTAKTAKVEAKPEKQAKAKAKPKTISSGKKRGNGKVHGADLDGADAMPPLVTGVTWPDVDDDAAVIN